MEDQEKKHTCKFCGKSFPCGRSLGGHMRSHLINISSSSDHRKTEENFSKKKLPPLVNRKTSARTEISVRAVGQFGYGLKEIPNKSNKFSKPSEEDTLLHKKLCKECGKSFQSWKALFGHMKCHSVNGKSANSVEEDSWNSPKPVIDSQSESETMIPLCKRKRSNRLKRYKVTTNSSSLTIDHNFWPSVSNTNDQLEQEEVALSLIILSGDKGDWGGILNSVVESSDNISEFLEAKKIAKTFENVSKSDNSRECLKFKKLRNEKLEPTKHNSEELKAVTKLELKSITISRNDEFRADDKIEKENLDIEYDESEVNSPKNLIKGSFETDCKKNKSRKRKSTNANVDEKKLPLAYFEKTSKFKCSICKKAFSSYQALGGHRASHKKFNGGCAPRFENSLETENSRNQSETLFSWKKNKEHECPICFKLFPSGQALGGHKRSHLVADQAKKNASLETEEPIREIHHFLDLNLPAPVDEESNDFEPWWIL